MHTGDRREKRSPVQAPVVISGVIPSLGGMKQAELRAQTTGLTVPPGAEHIDKANQSIQPKEGVKPSIPMFVVPMLIVMSRWVVVLERIVLVEIVLCLLFVILV